MTTPTLPEALGRLRHSIEWLRDGKPHANGIGVADMVDLEEGFRTQAEELERLRGLKAECPPRPDHHNDASHQHRELPRYGLRWNGPGEPVSVPTPDGYWTPFHLALLAAAPTDEEIDQSIELTWRMAWRERDQRGVAGPVSEDETEDAWRLHNENVAAICDQTRPAAAAASHVRKRPMSQLKRYELKAIGAAIGWMADCLSQPVDETGQEAWDREREKLRIAKAAHRKLNADYKASRPKVAKP